MSYQDKDYEEMLNRADDFMGKNKPHEAWECISAIPEEVKVTEYVDDCAFFASIALNTQHFNDFLRYFKVYLNTVPKADKAFAEDIADLFYIMTTNYDSKIYPYVIEVIKTVLAKFRTTEVLTICAGLYNMMGTPEKALPLLDEALDKDPFYSKAWYEKVYAYHFMNDTEKEVECCNYYLAIEPDTEDFSILVPIANSYSEAERHEDAIATLKKALKNKELMPEHAAAVHCFIAESYRLLADKKKELAHRQKALELFPEEVRYWSMLAQYYITTEQKPLKAEKIMQEAMEKYPGDPLVHYMFANVECQIAIDFNSEPRLAIAAEHIELAIKKIKKDPLFYLLAARIYLLLKDYTPALKHARHIYRMEPNDNSAILYMVLATLGCGKLTEFRKMYRIYEKINPTAREDILTIMPEAKEVIDKMK